jgi:hypothetical protein
VTTLREAAQQALEALQTVFMPFHPAVIDLKAALEQPEQEPELQLDGMTPLQFALEELHAFQEATGCDTASEFRAALEQPYAEQARRVEQETHGRMRINPVTGDVSIGTPTEQPEQEPVAWLNSRPLYYDPPRREWRGLTEEEKLQILDDTMEGGDLMDMARAIEQALKEKNA